MSCIALVIMRCMALVVVVQEEELAWAQWCNQQQIYDPNVQVCAPTNQPARKERA